MARHQRILVGARRNLDLARRLVKPEPTPPGALDGRGRRVELGLWGTHRFFHGMSRFNPTSRLNPTSQHPRT